MKASYSWPWRWLLGFPRLGLPEPFSKLIISVPRAVFEKEFQNLNHLTATRISSRNHSSNQSTLSQLCHGMHQMDKSTFLSYSLPMLEILKECLIESGGRHRDISTLKALPLFRVKQFIQTHLENENLSAEDISQGVRLSSRYINELLQHQNTSLMRFLTEKRLERSQHFLSNAFFSDPPITDIAFRCGFKNFSHFSRVFKESFRYSPREYRQLMTK